MKVENSLGFHSLSFAHSKTNPAASYPSSHPPASESDSSSSGDESDSDSSDSEDETFTGQPPNVVPTVPNQSHDPYLSMRQESRPFKFEYEDISQDVESEGGQLSPHPPNTSVGRISHQKDLRSSKDDTGVSLSNKRRKNGEQSFIGKSPRLGSESGLFEGAGQGEEPLLAKDASLMVHIPLWKVSEISQKTAKPQVSILHAVYGVSVHGLNSII